MEAIGRQEMAYSKLARTRFNCYKDGDYGEIVEHLQYVLTSLDPYMICFDELNIVEKPLLLVKDSCRNQLLPRDVKLEQSCFELKCWHDILDLISLVRIQR
ncbi:hypothetical protein M9H77_16766 [Catharanthus roseus]|uniref:Uncharacterized protein n=1 Tax=Catharanthus roseus TaxID=4058 RepID=A0ACC0B2Q7_CATRO|nr:hypothetical protein M9H77_16766 [Catharanthus roseus]